MEIYLINSLLGNIHRKEEEEEVDEKTSEEERWIQTLIVLNIFSATSDCACSFLVLLEAATVRTYA